MKSIKLILLFTLFITGAAFSQVISVPEKSKEHFAKKYPAVKNPDWKNNVTYYSAGFTSKKDSYRVVYHMDGTWDYTEKKITKNSLPKAVSTSFQKSRFADWETRSFAYVENNDGEKLYRIETKRGIEKKYVFFDKNGKEIKATPTI